MLVCDDKEFTKMTELKIESKFYARGVKQGSITVQRNRKYFLQNNQEQYLSSVAFERWV